MKTSDIGAIIDKFIESNSSAIMFDGNWGIGKTYAIEKLLKEERYTKNIYDYCNLHYISLFGFKDIELLHKELYKKFHPYKAKSTKVLSYISLAVSLKNASIGFNTSEIRKDIEENQTYKTLSKQDWKNVIIFDDIERVAAKKDGFIELFGYFNRLINEGIKIIAICNSNALEEENKGVFKKFSEKIFDRTYSITEDNEESLKNIFAEVFSFLDTQAIALLDNNLRFAKKAKIFIDDVFKKAEENKDLKSVSGRIVCLACILIVKEVFTSSVSEKYIKEQTHKTSEDNTLYTKILLSEYGTDEFSIKAINKELEGNNIQGVSLLVKGLFDYFKYYDSSFFAKKDEQKRLLTKSIFYYNDYDKEIAIREVVDKICKNCEEYTSRQIYDAIRDIMRYNDGILKDKDFNNLVNKICEIKDENKRQEIINDFDHDLYFEHSEEEEKFVRLLNKKLKEQEKDGLIKYLHSINVDNYDGSLMGWITKLQGRNEKLDEEICELLKSKKFFLPDLSKTLNLSQWDFCHEICSFVIKVDDSLKKGIVDVLEEQLMENPTMKCVKERVEALKKYALKIKED